MTRKIERPQLYTQDTYTTLASSFRRLGTFQISRWPASAISIVDLAEAGFFYLQHKDYVQCCFCKGTLGDWIPNQNPFDEHKLYFPSCPLIAGLETGNISLYRPSKRDQNSCLPSCRDMRATEVLERHGLQKHVTPRFPKYALLEHRLQSYTAGMWCPVIPANVKCLAEAGFFFFARPDLVACFFCGAVLGNFKTGNDPLIEHLVASFDCLFLRRRRDSLMKNIDLFESKYKDLVPKEELSPQSPNDSNSPFLAFKITSTATLFIKAPPSCRLSSDNLDILIHYLWHVENIRSFKSFKALFRAILCVLKDIDQSPPPIKRSKLDDCSQQSSKTSLKCVICLDKEMRVAVFPCRHFVSCEDCIIYVADCPICRTKIKSNALIYVSAK